MIKKHLKRGLGCFLSVVSVLQSHVCAASCIASRNHGIKKLETHIADRKLFKIVPGNFIVLFYTMVCYHKKRKRLTTKIISLFIPFGHLRNIYFLYCEIENRYIHARTSILFQLYMAVLSHSVTCMVPKQNSHIYLVRLYIYY